MWGYGSRARQPAKIWLPLSSSHVTRCFDSSSGTLGAMMTGFFFGAPAPNRRWCATFVRKVVEGVDGARIPGKLRPGSGRGIGHHRRIFFCGSMTKYGQHRDRGSAEGGQPRVPDTFRSARQYGSQGLALDLSWPEPHPLDFRPGRPIRKTYAAEAAWSHSPSVAPPGGLGREHGRVVVAFGWLPNRPPQELPSTLVKAMRPWVPVLLEIGWRVDSPSCIVMYVFLRLSVKSLISTAGCGEGGADEALRLARNAPMVFPLMHTKIIAAQGRK